MMSATRTRLIRTVARSLATQTADGVVRVAVDGVDGSGKTVFANELAEAVSGLGRPTIRASVDGFHNPRHIRYRRGASSPEGYLRDSYDYPALRTALLDPLSAGGSGWYRRTVFDHTTDRPVDPGVEEAPARAILVFDGIFLHRPELIEYWDHTVFLQADFAVTFARMARRDGTDPDPGAPSNRRYLHGQRRYLATYRPAELASIVIDNNDLDEPRIVRITESDSGDRS
jgi:uridine kinase